MQIRTIQPLIGLSLLLCILGSFSTIVLAADAATAVELSAPYQEINRYKITRKGKNIGTHELRFNRNGDSLEVSVSSRIKVTVLKIPVFRLNYTATELWNKTQLMSVAATTVTNGKSAEVSLTSDGTANSTIVSNGTTVTVPAIFYSTNHWNPGVLGATRVFNTIKGEASTVSIKTIGTEEVQIGTGSITATHYEYTGDIRANTWYDKNGRWVKLSFAGEDGSQIDYVLEE